MGIVGNPRGKRGAVLAGLAAAETAYRLKGYVTGPKRQRRMPGPGRRRMRRDVGGCYSSQYVTKGYKLSSRRYRNKLIDSARLTNVYRISGQNQAKENLGNDIEISHALYKKNGFYPLAAFENPTSKICYYPIYAIDLTAVPNQALNQTTPSYTPSVYRMSTVTKSKGSNVTWGKFDADIFSTYQTFQLERGFGDPCMGPKGLLNWIQAKFLFYPPSNFPTRINIDIVRFKEDGVVPCGESEPQVITEPQYKAFWEGMVKKYHNSPIEGGNTTLERKFIQYLWRDSFVLDCKTNIENEQNHVRQYNLFKRMNRLCKYDWGDTGTMNAVPATDLENYGGAGGQEWIQNLDVYNRTQVRQPQRVFMIIRAFAGFAEGAGAFERDTRVFPSFDMVLRKSMTVLRA